MPFADDWEGVRSVARQLERGEAVDVTDAVRALLVRVAPTVGVSEPDATAALAASATTLAMLVEASRRIREGSRRLMRAQSEESKLKMAGDTTGIRQLYEDLLAVEVVPLYREQAQIGSDYADAPLGE
ncbi:DUSAM domain-containing protein [Myxococcaceae bacterium JPH2]|nr:DUSAM domain-containing protein [Myxococcaceae bacterium JPH2]